MTLLDMKGLPHLVKPVALGLILFQVIFVFAPGYRGFGWFVITTTMIQLIACIATFLLILADITVLTEASFWPMAEMGYSGAFTLFELINFFYFLVNMCNHYNFWLMCGEFFSAFLCLIWLFNALQWWRAPPPLTTSKGPSKRGRSNQDDVNTAPGSNTIDYSTTPTRSYPDDFNTSPRSYPNDFNTAPTSYADDFNTPTKSYPNGVNPAPRSYPAGFQPASRSYPADDYYYD